MGFYVNPPMESKESFLAREGCAVSRDVFFSFDDWSGPNRPVILVDNGWMTAAGVMYNAGELKAWNDSTDHRPMKFYVVEITKLVPVSDEGLEDAIAA